MRNPFPCNHTQSILLLIALYLFSGYANANDGSEVSFKRTALYPSTEVFNTQFLESMYTTREETVYGGLRSDKLYMHIVKLKQEGKTQEALTAFRDYFLKKLRNPQAYGLTEADLSPLSHGNSGIGSWAGPQFQDLPKEKVIRIAQLLMRGKDEKGKEIGLPGKVKWNTVLLSNMKAFNMLIHAYALTNDEEYVKQYVRYLDDWAQGDDILVTSHPCKVPHSSREDPTRRIVRLLATIAKSPNAEQLLPAETLARVVDKLLKFSYNHAIYLRSNCHNWTPTPAMVVKALMFPEFKVSENIFREAVRRNMEDNAITQNLRDGGENQQCPWYNDNYLQVHQFLRLLEARTNIPMWREAHWIQEWRNDHRRQQDIRDHMTDRVNYLLKNRTPQNEWASPWRGGDKRNVNGVTHVSRYGNYRMISPDAYKMPENSQIIEAITNPSSGVRPDLKANWFPYAGFNTIWEGWERFSGYGALFCSPVPGAYGAHRSRSNNNTFGLSAFGADLLIDDTVGHYMYPTSPIRVNGKDQYFHTGIHKVRAPSNHKKYLVLAWQEPSNYRWHSSGTFNLMEGVYEGDWDSGEKVAYKLPGGVVKHRVPGAKVRHQRLVHYLRGTPIWIVTDRMTALDEKSHSYEQVWRIPTQPSGTAAYKDEDIVVDESMLAIRATGQGETNEQGTLVKQPSFSLYTIGNHPIQYKSKSVPRNEKNRYMISARKDISVNWQASGTSQMLSLIIPREQGVSEESVFSSFERWSNESYNGFTGKLQDGRTVSFISSVDKVEEFLIDGVSAVATSLMVVSSQESKEVLVLDCQSLSILGNAITLSEPNAEVVFSRTGEVRVDPIYRPISPVEIFPPRNVFMDTLDVSLKSKTPNVEIRYTLDGTEPTPSSTLYESPFTLNASATVKARAYRKGVLKNPAVLSGTHATVVSRAHFDKKLPIQADSLKKSKLQPGLKFKYFEDRWQSLWMNLDSLKPLKSQTGTDLFDLTPIPSSNRPISDAQAPRQKYYAVSYTGYLDIPKDGVYTFHAPHEFVYPDVEQGYELNLQLGQRLIDMGWNKMRPYGLNQWYPATTRHAFGNWSIALKKGLHPVVISFADFRTDAAKELNEPNLNKYIWDGVVPELLVSGPGLDKQPVPSDWLFTSP